MASPDFQVAYQQLRADPAFKKLTYGEQQQAVKAVLDSYIAKDEEFVALRPEDRATAYQSAVASTVGAMKPGLTRYADELTPEDRMALAHPGLLGGLPGPGDSAKRALWLGERMAAGDKTAELEAYRWVVANRAGTESLIWKIAAGAKDAAEALVNPQERLFDDMAFNTSDYHKLADYLIAKMPDDLAAQTKNSAGFVGFASGMFETTLMSAVGVGTAKLPGLFTKGLWKGVETARLGAKTVAAEQMFSTVVPYVISGVGSGAVDLARSLPQLIETGQVQGNGAFWAKAASVFGEGVAYDVLFNGLQDVFRLGVLPTVKALRGFNLKDTKMVAQMADVLASGDPDSMGPMFSQVLGKTLPSELLDRVPKAYKAKLVQTFQRFNALQTIKEFSPESPEGFTFLAKAMGQDVKVDINTGAVDVLTPLGTTYRSFGTKTEAISWFQSKDFQPLPADFDEALVGAQRGARVRTVASVQQTLKELPVQQLTHMIGVTGPSGMVDRETTIAAIDELWIRSHGQGHPFTDVIDMPETEWLAQVQSGTLPREHLYLPTTMSQTTRTRWFEYFNKGLTARDPSMTTFMPGANALTEESLDLAARRLGGSVVKSPDGWTLSRPGQKPMVFSELNGLNRQVFKDLIATKTMSEEDFLLLFHRATGFTVDVTENHPVTGLPSYAVWDRKGHLIQRVDSLDSLVNSAPEFEIKLPDFLMPEIVVRDGKLKVTQTVATGRPSDLYKFMKDFDSGWFKPTTGQTRKIQLADGTISTFNTNPGRFQVAVEVPSVGYLGMFDNERAAMDFLSKVGTSTEVLEKIAYDKGFRVDTLASGGLVFRDQNNAGIVTRNVEEAKRFLAAQPSKDVLGKELASSAGPTVDEVINESVKKSLADDPVDSRFVGPESHRFVTSLAGVIDAKIRPFMSWAETTAQRLGAPEMYDKVRTAALARRAVSIENHNASAVMQELFTDPSTGKILSRTKAKLFGQLMEVDPENWTAQAKNLMLNADYDLSESDRKMLFTARGYFKALGDKFNIDFIGFHKNYVPHIQERASMEELIDTLKNGDRAAVLAKMFGPDYQNVPAIGFLVRNGRLDDFINVHNRKNIIELATYYTEKGHRELYLKQPLAELSDYAKSLAGVVDDETVLKLHEFGVAMAGNTPDDAASRFIRNGSVALSERLNKAFLKMSTIAGGDTKAVGRIFKTLADNSAKENWLEWATSNVSPAVLGFRPFRIAANMAQFMNTYGVYGHWAMDATRMIDSDYIRRLFKLGILNERVFAATSDGIEHIQKTVGDLAMSWQQNTEYLTRAWTAKAAEMSFDDGLRKLSNGIVDWDGFKDMAHLNVLSEESQAEIHKLLQAGQVAAAKDVAMVDSVRILMFDYSKENYPGLFTSTLGRMYGKFGVYKVGQFDLYRRLLASRKTAEGYQRLIRLAAASFLVYNAFQAAGVDYNGFKLVDPLTLTGGPVWEAMVDVTRSTGSGPEAALARRNLLRNFSPVVKADDQLKFNIPRLMFPGALQAAGVAKGAEAIANGDTYGGFLDLLGAPHDDKPFDAFGYVR